MALRVAEAADAPLPQGQTRVESSLFSRKSRMSAATAYRVALIAIVAMLSGTACALGDVVLLKNGGQVRGRLQTSADAPVVVIETLLGGTVAIDQSSIENLEQRSLLVERYESRARAVEDTVEARWKLAEWCKMNGLPSQREEQLLLLLDLDPDHEDARRILGHVIHRGKWVTRDEWMTDRGYVKHNGKYVTRQERDLLVKSEAERAAETAWYPNIRLWFKWATGRNPERASAGLAKLDELDDPDAVPALVNFLGDHRDTQVRLLCVRLLGRLPGPKPVEPLVKKSLRDNEKDVRIAARNAIGRSQYELALQHYVPELQNESNTVVQRAAVAIRDIGDMTVVPYLIPALVTSHRWKVEVPAAPSVAIGRTLDGQFGLGQSSWLPPEVEGLARTGQLPYGAVVVPNGLEPRITRTVTIKGDVKNSAVLEALKKITGQDFGYNKRAWETWWQTQAAG